MFITRGLRFYLLALIMLAHEVSAATINLAGGAENSDSLGHAVAAGNFNCDSFDDMAGGVPWEDVSGLTNAGVVNIVYGGTGSGGRLGATGNHYIQAGGTPAENDQFGSVLAAGDFNGDNCDDLAVGMPNRAVSGQLFAGQVIILYGHTNGPGYALRQTWHQDASGVHGGPEEDDLFGSSLATGDFNGDGRADLAIGVTGENSYAGGVHVLHGNASGLTAASSLYIDQNTSGVADDREPFDHFGSTLTSGDFNGDGYGDLAVGVPEESVAEQSFQVAQHGVVNVLYGSVSSLSGTGSQLWRQGSGLPGQLGDLDHFGASLAAGDFDGDGRDDLAIGVPLDHDFHGPAGSIYVLYGTTTGLSSTGRQILNTNHPDIALDADSDFGGTLAAGNFNGDAWDDLAIGARYNNTGGVNEGGAVQVLYGHDEGLPGYFNTLIHQDIDGVDDTVESGNRFGSPLVAGDFNNDGKDDLGVGIPYEEITAGVTNSGAMQVFYGALPLPGGLRPDDDQLFVQ